MPTTSRTNYSTRISQLLRQGKSGSDIASTLNAEHISTPTGKTRWSSRTVERYMRSNTKKRSKGVVASQRVGKTGSIYNAVNTLLSSEGLNLEQKLVIMNTVFGDQI